MQFNFPFWLTSRQLNEILLIFVFQWMRWDDNIQTLPMILETVRSPMFSVRILKSDAEIIISWMGYRWLAVIGRSNSRIGSSKPFLPTYYNNWSGLIQLPTSNIKNLWQSGIGILIEKFNVPITAVISFRQPVQSEKKANKKVSIVDFRYLFSCLLIFVWLMPNKIISVTWTWALKSGAHTYASSPIGPPAAVPVRNSLFV